MSEIAKKAKVCYPPPFPRQGRLPTLTTAVGKNCHIQSSEERAYHRVMKLLKIIIVVTAFYTPFGHAANEPAAPYNLRWEMSYDEARNTPLYSLEVSDINYAGRDPNLIASTLSPQEVGEFKYQEMKLYFDKNKGLKSIYVNAIVDYSNRSSKVDDGKEALALYNEEVKSLDREYGMAITKEEFIADKNKFYQSLYACITKYKEWSNKGLDSSKMTHCSKWQRSYKKGRVTVLLYVEPRQVSKQYIYK